MSYPRPERPGQEREVIYSEEHWKVLREKREKALRIMQALREFDPIVHGSVARGDVSPDSDVDVVLLSPVPYSIVKTLLESRGFKISHVELVMATPKTTPKLYIYLDPEEEQVVTLPIVRLSKVEEEFYRFSGMLKLQELESGRRVPGVNKRLMFIQPTEKGHVEWCIIGREHEVAELLGVSIDVVLERVQMLTRRAEIGRTGTFIRLVLDPDEPVEDVVRRELERRGIRWVLSMM